LTYLDELLKLLEELLLLVVGIYKCLFVVSLKILPVKRCHVTRSA
jgi:hypothetical protein